MTKHKGRSKAQKIQISGITSLTEQKMAGQSSSLVQIFPSGSHVEATASGASLTISIVPFIYGAVHLVTTYCVQLGNGRGKPLGTQGHTLTLTPHKPYPSTQG